MATTEWKSYKTLVLPYYRRKTNPSASDEVTEDNNLLTIVVSLGRVSVFE